MPSNRPSTAGDALSRNVSLAARASISSIPGDAQKLQRAITLYKERVSLWGGNKQLSST
jgi:hypothetical protein